MPKFYLILVFIFHSILASSQNTVGIISYNEELSFPGYNLFFSHNQSNVFLINECGEVVHEWTDSIEFRPGNSVYLLDNGNLVKCKRHAQSAVNDPIWAGGGGETVEIVTWDNELLASYTLNDSLFRLHHDVAPLPNGNILMILWEAKSKEDALSKGRDPELLDQDRIWSLAIYEWQPDIDSIVWEWHAWDHLIQDFDQDASNFGVIPDHPELIDINYALNGNPDWLHTNAIDYNPVLDQIVLSVPHFDELWIIDHSTKTEEAASPTGGNSGKGGDLLYRWGNPLAFDIGDTSDQKLFFQHDVNWIEPEASEGNPNFGKLILFNNRLPDQTSTINILQTPVQGFDYELQERGDFGPVEFERTIIHPDLLAIAFSSGLSSAQYLPNGNVLVLSGRWGFAYEITPDDKIVWEYIIPFKAGSPVNQGDTMAVNYNITFRMNRYPLNFPAFDNKDLTPIKYLENMPDTSYCASLLTSDVEDKVFSESFLKIFPNPSFDLVNIEGGESLIGKTYTIYDIEGRTRITGNTSSPDFKVDLSGLNKGIYFLKIGTSKVAKLIKN